MHRGNLCLRAAVLAGAVLIAFSSLAAQGAVSGRPVLEIEQAQDFTRIWVEVQLPGGSMARSLLRETESVVTPNRTGVDPSGRAAFATWDEAGSRWFSYSRDGGSTWAESSPLKLDLRIRDGAVMPGKTMPAPGAGLALPADGRLFLVQFRTVGLPEWRSALASLGIEVLNHVPHNGHIVRMNPALASAALALDFVERVEPYHPWYRLDTRLRSWLDAGEEGADTVRRVNVMAFEWGEEGKNRIADTAWALGAAVVENWPSGHIVEIEVTRDQLRALAASDDVLWIDPWSEPENDMDIVREDAGTNYIEDNFGYCGQGVRGEVMDGGTQPDHQDFDGIILHGSNSTSSHGTNTYGIVFGNGARDGDGEAKATGHMPCPEAQGIAADYGFLGDRFAHTQELTQDPYFASFQTNSWGDARTLIYTSVSHEMDDIIWRLDFAITQSQSNSGNQDSRPQAWAKNIISVGGVYHHDTLDTSDDAWNGGASIGPAEDGRIKPDVCYWYDDIYTTTSGGGYTAGFGGTSAATPETAGILGLMVQMWADNVWETDPIGDTVFGKQPHFSTMKALLINNAQQYDFTGQSHDLTRVHQGWGRSSLELAKDRATTSFIIDEEVVLELGDFSIFEVDVQPGETELKVTMVYPDPPGTTSAAMHRINNVNLKVTSPSATIYHGNHGLLDGKYSTPGGEPNELDTVENVFIENPESGIWQVEVTAPEINQDAYLDTPDDDVTFALVVTGGTSQLIQPSAGRIRLDKDSYGCDHKIGIRVIDGNAGTSTVTVDLSSESELLPEDLTLTETKPGSGKYSGEIWTTSAAPVNGDNLLSVTHDDVISVAYVDADDGEGGTNLVRTDTATADCQEPLISYVGTEGVSDDRATVVWTTDETATSEVVWGETIPPTESETGFGRVTDHAIQLTGLSECTIYYYEVRSADRHGNEGADDNGGSFYHFETLGDFGSGLQPCHAGQVSIGGTVYSCSDTVTFQVVDLDLNFDPGYVDSATLYLTSTSEADVEPVVVTETGPNTSTFTGSIATSGGVPSPDGVLQTGDGDTITVTYRDENDGTGTPAISFDTAVADCAGPVIENLRIQDVTDNRFTVFWTTPECADTVVEWGTTPALGETESNGACVTNHAVVLNQFDICTEAFVRVSSTDQHGNTATADLGGMPYAAFTFDIPGLYSRETFENGASGWTLEGEWEIGEPQGLGGSTGWSDPSGAYNNSRVLGHDLSGQGAYPGDYEPFANENARSPVHDAGSWTNTKLIFHRYLNTGSDDDASVWLWTDGVGRPVFLDSGEPNSASSFERIALDIGQVADGASSVHIEFKQAAGSSGQYSGWNIDDLMYKDGSLPDFGACDDCSGAPSFAGAVSVVDNSACNEIGMTVSWNDVFSWGTGGGGTFAVYRDTSPGFTPSAGNRIASGVAGQSYIDFTAPIGQQVWYLVRAESDETCGGGPNNGGVTDGNQVYVTATDTNNQPVPGEVDDLLVRLVNGVHVRLYWTAPTDAVEYRLYRSTDPQPGGFLLLGETTETFFDDESSGANANTFYYLVRAANACGQEGP